MVGEEGPLEGRVDDLMHISNADYEKAVAAGRIFFFFFSHLWTARCKFYFVNFYSRYKDLVWCIQVGRRYPKYFAFFFLITPRDINN
jgi:hypothetical protein